MKRTLEGTGILSGTWDDEEIEREREEDRQKEAAAAERAAQQEATKHKLEETMLDYLRDEIAEELQDQKKKSSGSDKRNQDFKRFREYCARLDLPHLPAAPQTVAAFLANEVNKGRPHLRRLIKSISTTHLRCDLHDPTTDLLVRALLRLARDEPQQTVNPS